MLVFSAGVFDVSQPLQGLLTKDVATCSLNTNNGSNFPGIPLSAVYVDWVFSQKTWHSRWRTPMFKASHQLQSPVTISIISLRKSTFKAMVQMLPLPKGILS